MEGNTPAKNDSICSVVKGLSTGTLEAVLLALFPEHQTSFCCHRTICSALSLSESRVSIYKQDFVCWPFKRAPGSLADSCLSLVERIPTDFYSQILFGHFFSALVLKAGESSVRLKTLLLRGDFCS